MRCPRRLWLVAAHGMGGMVVCDPRLEGSTRRWREFMTLLGGAVAWPLLFEG
jgi:hypothetical protein